MRLKFQYLSYGPRLEHPPIPFYTVFRAGDVRRYPRPLVPDEAHVGKASISIAGPPVIARENGLPRIGISS